jgi:hypothetical protein
MRRLPNGGALSATPRRSRVLGNRLWLVVMVWPAILYVLGNARVDCDGFRDHDFAWHVEQAVFVMGTVMVPTALGLLIVFLVWRWWWRALASALISVLQFGVLLNLALECGVGS